MGRTNKDNKYKSYRSDKARDFNRDEKRKQKHERDALRSGNVEKLIQVEDEAGNTFFSTDTINDTLSEKESTEMTDAYDKWLDNQKGLLRDD